MELGMRTASGCVRDCFRLKVLGPTKNNPDKAPDKWIHVSEDSMGKYDNAVGYTVVTKWDNVEKAYYTVRLACGILKHNAGAQQGRSYFDDLEDDDDELVPDDN
jgi:hypothetical protein